MSAPAILIVEDERIVAAHLQRSLGDMGFDAFAIADSAEAAIACAAVKRPDVVLMDIRIKGPEDGIQTAAILKKKFPVIVIYLTAYADDTMIDRAKRTEPYGYLRKPVKDTDLRCMIDIAIYKRDMETTRETLRAAERRLSIITDNVPVSIACFDCGGHVLFANHVFRELAPSRDHAAGVGANNFLGDSLHDESYPYRQRALSGEQVSCLAQFKRNGLRQTHEVTYLPARDPGGTVVGVYAIGHDVTERERLSADLQRARADLETTLNNVPPPITAWRADSTNRFANKAADTLRHGHDHHVPEIQDGAVTGLYALAFDITDLRNSHEQIRQLTQRLETVREEEGHAVAMSLHDGMAQDLFSVKLGLNYLEAQTKRRIWMTKVCQELSLVLTKCIEETRQVANALRPVALASFGVVAAIKEHSRRLAEHSKLRINVTETADFPKLIESTQLLLFRAAQEALTNVARHARATAVEIVLRAENGQVTMSIADDGIGITDAAMHKARSLGLLGIRERFAALGGGLLVRRRERTGTIVTVYLPVPNGEPIR
jgi:PAS domain S-box-containing protein